MAAPRPELYGGEIDSVYSRVAIVRSSDDRVVDIVMSSGTVFTDAYDFPVIAVPVLVGELCDIFWLYDNLVVPGNPNRFYSDGANYEESLTTPMTVFPGSIAVGNNPPISNRGYHIQFPDGTTQDSAVNRTRLTTFTALQEFAAGISSGQILTIDPTDGVGLIAAKAMSGGNSRIGGVRLGYADGTAIYNTLLHNSSGTFTIYNGFSSTGSNLLNISSTVMNVNVPVSGMTFTGNVVGPNIVNSVNGATGAVSITYAAASTITSSNANGTRYITFVGGTGNTGLFIDDVTTPLSYNPQQGNISAKKVTLTTGSNVVTVDSTGNTVTLTDGANVSTFGLESFASSNSIPFELSAAVGLTLTSSSGGIAMAGSGYYYKFPESNGSSNQVLTTNGAGTLSWSTVSGGGGGSGFTYTASAPATPAVGDRWLDSDTGKEYVYVNDGSSSQWIEPVSSNGLSGVTYTSATNFIEFGVTGSFVKLGVNNTSPQYTLDVNGVINTPVGISAAGATFSGAVTSDGGYRITSSAINAQTGTTYTLLTADNGKIITMNNASASTVTIPSGLPIGYNTTVIQLGLGQVGFTGSGTTINSSEGKLNIANRYSAANIISYTTNTFILAGGLTA